MDMNDGLAVLGTLVQTGGSGYLVWTSRRTAKRLDGFASRQTIDKFSDAAVDLANEVRGQFDDQRRGFLWVCGGSALQIAAALKLLG